MHASAAKSLGISWLTVLLSAPHLTRRRGEANTKCMASKLDSEPSIEQMNRMLDRHHCHELAMQFHHQFRKLALVIYSCEIEIDKKTQYEIFWCYRPLWTAI